MCMYPVLDPDPVQRRGPGKRRVLGDLVRHRSWVVCVTLGRTSTNPHDRPELLVEQSWSGG